MSKNNITILVWLYKSRLNKAGQAPLYVRVSYDNDRKNIATGYNVPPKKWDKSKMKVKGADEEAKIINEYIQQTQSKLVSIYNDMMKDGDVHLDKIIDRFFGRDYTPMTLLELLCLNSY